MFDTAHFHPQLVHFPIALILAGFLADLLYLYKKVNWLYRTGYYLMILGTIGAWFAAGSGELFTDHPTEGAVVKVFEAHFRAALTTVIIMTIVLLIRTYFLIRQKEDKFRWPIFILYLLGAISVSLTGYLGGTMVYTYFLGI